MHVEADLAGEAIHVKEVDVDAYLVFDGVAANVPHDDVASGHLFVVDEKQGGRCPVEIHGDLAAGPGGPGQFDGVVEITDVLMAALRRVNDGGGPFVGGPGEELADQLCAAPPDGDELDVTSS